MKAYDGSPDSHSQFYDSICYAIEVKLGFEWRKCDADDMQIVAGILEGCSDGPERSRAGRKHCTAPAVSAQEQRFAALHTWMLKLPPKTVVALLTY